MSCAEDRGPDPHPACAEARFSRPVAAPMQLLYLPFLKCGACIGSPLAPHSCQSGGQGTRTLTSTFVEICVSSAVQQTDICLSSLSGVRGEKPSRLTPHLSLFSASSRNRTDTFSLEDCNAAFTPHSPFNAGTAETSFQKVFWGPSRIFSYPERESNPLYGALAGYVK